MPVMLIWLTAAAEQSRGFDPTPIVVAMVAGMLGAIPGALAYKSSKRANAANERKVDQEAYDRAVLFYQRQVDDANKQLDRVQAQVDSLQDQLRRVNGQLFDEQEASAGFRSQIRGLQATVDILNSTINDLKVRLEVRVDDPAKAPKARH